MTPTLRQLWTAIKQMQQDMSQIKLQINEERALRADLQQLLMQHLETSSVSSGANTPKCWLCSDTDSHWEKTENKRNPAAAFSFKFFFLFFLLLPARQRRNSRFKWTLPNYKEINIIYMYIHIVYNHVRVTIRQLYVQLLSSCSFCLAPSI